MLFIDLNGGVWDPDPPDIDQAEEAMLAIAAGDVDEAWTAQWLRQRVRFGEATQEQNAELRATRRSCGTIGRSQEAFLCPS